MPSPPDLALDHPFGDRIPAPGSAIDVAPGLRWLRMPLPFALDHINLWLLRDRADGPDGPVEGWAVVDTGIDDAATRAAWRAVEAAHLDGLPVLRVIVTHMHPDHVGLAHWLTGRWSRPGADCRLWISATDWHAAHLASRRADDDGAHDAAAFYAAHGLSDPAAQAQVRRRRHHYAELVPEVPTRFRRLSDGQVVQVGARAWRCLVGHGHAPEHVALHDAAGGVLISGDMVLPRISTNVSVYDSEPEADPLTMFLASLDAMRALPADTLVLPSHGRPFRGLHRRIDQLHAHHAERLADVVAACAAAPRHAADLLPVLFPRQLDAHQVPFAIGESLAHLNALWLSGRLRREVDAGGTVRFAAVDRGR